VDDPNPSPINNMINTGYKERKTNFGCYTYHANCMLMYSNGSTCMQTPTYFFSSIIFLISRFCISIYLNQNMHFRVQHSNSKKYLYQPNVPFVYLQLWIEFTGVQILLYLPFHFALVRWMSILIFSLNHKMFSSIRSWEQEFIWKVKIQNGFYIRGTIYGTFKNRTLWTLGITNSFVDWPCFCKRCAH